MAANGAPDSGGEAAEDAPLVDQATLMTSAVAGKSRALSGSLWGRAYLGAYEVTTAEGRLLMVEVLSKGALSRAEPLYLITQD